MKTVKPWYKSKTLWWIVASTIAGSAQPIGVAIDKGTIKFGDLGGLMAIVATNAMAGYSRIIADTRLSGGIDENRH
ncbi:hypothetical protein [Chamaesiphon sp. OTE_8_metabat_110]|uniref:hypothetical protein n=1 Tax=Chamaesiphon sp. OTE_8_metabat_110 TaxID=2964696 RepID=UPI00286D6891|nr:hypothetical protein [Chamaesiphon sp. OTE_8_metabat_110]